MTEFVMTPAVEWLEKDIYYNYKQAIGVGHHSLMFSLKDDHNPNCICESGGEFYTHCMMNTQSRSQLMVEQWMLEDYQIACMRAEDSPHLQSLT